MHLFTDGSTDSVQRVTGDLHEADWHDPDADVPAKAEGLELTPVHNGTFNITWRPPQAIQDVRGFVVMLRHNVLVRYFYFNMSYYIMNQYPKEQMRTSDIQMGLVAVDPFQLFDIPVLGEVDAEVFVSIISMPGFNISVLPSVNKSIIVQRRGELWQTHINITNLPNDAIQGCFNLAPASLNISSYTVDIIKGMTPVQNKNHNITEEDLRSGQTCTKFDIHETGNFSFRMKPIRCESRCNNSRANFTFIADRNDCINVTCQHGGTCQDRLDSYTCECSSRYTGTHCEQIIDQCESSPCSSGSTCVDGEDSFTCACHSGFTGELCDKDVDDCINNPCMHGECIDNHDSYKCDCHIGWTGKHCEMIHAMILVFAMLSVIMVTTVVVLIVSIRTGRQQIIIIFASCRPSYEKNVNLIRRFLISKYNCDIHVTHSFDDLDENWKKYHQALIILSSEIDEGINKKLSDFKQQGEIHHHDIPYKLLAFKKANVKQFNNQQVIQIPSDLHHFKHILPNKMWPVSMFTNWRARSILSTMISSIYEEEDDDDVSSWKEIAVKCEQFRSINAEDLDGMLDCVSLEIRGVDNEAYTPDTLTVNKHDIMFNPKDIDV